VKEKHRVYKGIGIAENETSANLVGYQLRVAQIRRRYEMRNRQKDERRNVDRAVELARKTVERIGQMKSLHPPTSQTDTQWKDYLDNTEGAARSIPSYAMSIKGR